jgi:hypothetical protein
MPNTSRRSIPFYGAQPGRPPPRFKPFGDSVQVSLHAADVVAPFVQSLPKRQHLRRFSSVGTTGSTWLPRAAFAASHTDSYRRDLTGTIAWRAEVVHPTSAHVSGFLTRRRTITVDRQPRPPAEREPRGRAGCCCSHGTRAPPVASPGRLWTPGTSGGRISPLPPLWRLGHGGLRRQGESPIRPAREPHSAERAASPRVRSPGRVRSSLAVREP